MQVKVKIIVFLNLIKFEMSDIRVCFVFSLFLGYRYVCLLKKGTDPLTEGVNFLSFTRLSDIMQSFQKHNETLIKISF